ncbi:hypothetical protein [Arthrobacter sp. UYCu712]|uniref:hypothetical protein n=1 Tax=Arthrobacter sp. UYCu712 TaxID=3156340 RepID=UPI003397459A
MNTFQADAVEPGEEPGAAEPDPDAVASGDPLGDPVPADGTADVVLAPGLPPAVQTGVPFPSLLHPESAAAVSASAAAILIPREIAVPVMLPA